MDLGSQKRNSNDVYERLNLTSLGLLVENRDRRLTGRSSTSVELQREA